MTGDSPQSKVRSPQSGRGAEWGPQGRPIAGGGAWSVERGAWTVDRGLWTVD